MNMGQDRQMQMVGGNDGNQFGQYAGQITENQNGYNAVQNVGNQNPNGNGNVVAARAEGNAIGNNGNQIRCYNCRGLGHLARNCIVRPRRKGDLDEIKEMDQLSVEQSGGIVEQNPATVEETRSLYDSLYNNLAIKVEKVNTVNRKLKETNAELTTELARYKNQEKCFEISQDKYDKLERGDTATCSRESLKKKQLNKEIKPANYAKINQLLGVFVSQKAKSREELYFSNASKTATISKSISIPNEEFPDDTSPSVARKFLNEEAAKFVRDFKSLGKEAAESLAKHKALEFEIERLLRAVVSQDIMSIVQSNSVVDTSNLQTELDRTKEKIEICIIKKEKEYDVLWNNWYTKCEECKYDKISYDKAYNDMQQKIERLQAQLGDLKGKSKDTPGESDTHDSLSQKLENENMELEFQVPQKVDEMHDLSNLVTSNSVTTPQGSKVMKNDNVIAPGIRVDNTTKTRRPRPRSNTKNDRVHSVSKSSCIKNNEVEVEEHHRNLLLFKDKKHMLSKCNNIKLAIRNDKSEVVCAMCKQCLIIANHDINMLNYVNGMNSRGKKQKANVPNTKNQEKHKPRVTKPKKVRSKEILASPKPSKPRFCLRWSPTGWIFDLKGKIIASSESECQFNYSNDDNASYDRESKASHQFLLEVFGNWALRAHLFSVGQFCDSDLEVAFRRNTCFIRNLEGVDLLKGNRTTNLYTINLHDMAFASPFCLMARATSTKSWLWHQRLSHLNFDTINDLAKNDLVTGLPKFKYHKEHLCPSCEQGKCKRESHPPKPVPNSKQSWLQEQYRLMARSTVKMLTSSKKQQHVQHQPATIADNVPNAMFDENTFVNPFATPSTSAAESSSSQYVDPSNIYQPYPHE
ncbi:retrovirus-related pol polyprotein from transposon TNT 1-94 [Tanacetum coccineum]